MKKFSRKEVIKLLSKLLWDTYIAPDTAYDILLGTAKADAQRPDLSNLYVKILSTYDWYTILKMVPRERLEEMLDDSVLKRLFPKSLQQRYIYAREVLYR